MLAGSESATEHAGPGHARLKAVVACVYALVGLGLTLALDRSLRVSLIKREWYESQFLPLWVACLVLGATSILIRLPNGGLFGLLITGPPYGWYAWRLTETYLSRADVAGIEYAKGLLVSACLASSGVPLGALSAIAAGFIKGRIARREDAT